MECNWRIGVRHFVSAVWLIVLISGVSSLHAQNADSLRISTVPIIDSTNAAGIFFDKVLNTYRWNGQFSYQQNLGAFSVDVREQFRSTIIRTTRILVTDEQQLNLGAYYPLSDRWKAKGLISSFILSDNKSIGIQNASSHIIYGGAQFQPRQQIILEPMIGYRQDNQAGQQDRGPSLLLRGTANDLMLGDDYRSTMYGRFQIDQLEPRKLESDTFGIIIDKHYALNTNNQLRGLFTRSKRDFYFPADPSVQQLYGVTNNIESRTEHALTIGDSLQYPLSDNSTLGVDGTLFSRKISRDTRYESALRPNPATTINEFRIEGSAVARYRPMERLMGEVRFFLQEREERHESSNDSANTIIERRNNRTRRTSVAGSLSYEWTRLHATTLSASGTILRYDTPSSLNVDDRDELWYVLSFTSGHQLNRYLHVMISADASLTHLVYLSGRRSADNTWNRIFRLSPRVTYAPVDWLISINRFEVLANYTAYDYEDLSLTASIRSFAFRQLSFIDSTRIELTKKFAVEWHHHFKLYERGDLLWEDFRERVINSFDDKLILATLHYNVHNRLHFSVGIRYFSQLRYVHLADQRQLENSLKSIGPTSEILWTVGTRTNLALAGWYERQSQTNIATRGFSNFTMTLSVRI